MGERYNLDILAVCEIKLKERGDVMFSKVEEKISIVRSREKGKKGGGILIKYEL